MQGFHLLPPEISLLIVLVDSALFLCGCLHRIREAYDRLVREIAHGVQAPVVFVLTAFIIVLKIVVTYSMILRHI